MKRESTFKLIVMAMLIIGLATSCRKGNGGGQGKSGMVEETGEILESAADMPREETGGFQITGGGMDGLDVGIGYYFSGDGFLRFFDYNTGETALVCNKPNCKHEAWDGDVPTESRCNSYIGWFLNGFTEGGKLYLIYPNTPQNGEMILVESGPDRSDQRIVGSLDGAYVQGMAYRDNQLYLVLERTDLKRSEESGSKAFNTAIIKYDIKTGEQKVIRDEPAENSGTRILCADRENLYFKSDHTVPEGEADAIPQRIYEYYKLSVNDDSITPILEDYSDASIEHAAIYNGCIYASITKPNQPGSQFPFSNTFTKINMSDWSEELIPNAVYPTICDRYALYFDSSGGDMSKYPNRIYEYGSGQVYETDVFKKSEIGVVGQAGKGYLSGFLTNPDSNSTENIFIDYESLLKNGDRNPISFR